jgi:hypothetical protein
VHGFRDVLSCGVAWEEWKRSGHSGGEGLRCWDGERAGCWALPLYMLHSGVLANSGMEGASGARVVPGTSPKLHRPYKTRPLPRDGAAGPVGFAWPLGCGQRQMTPLTSPIPRLLSLLLQYDR